MRPLAFGVTYDSIAYDTFERFAHHESQRHRSLISGVIPGSLFVYRCDVRSAEAVRDSAGVK